MKRLIITLFIIILLAASYPFSILAQPSHTPHENPIVATASLDAMALLLSYGNIFNLAAISQYQNAQSILKELEHANIPDELQYLIDRYNNLSQQLLALLDNLESLLDEASTLLSRNQISDARQKLDAAALIIRDTRPLLENIVVATNALGNNLGVFVDISPNELQQAYARLEESQRRLQELINKLNQLYETLTERFGTQAVKLIPTELSLSITPTTVFVGDGITAWGRLSDGNSPLSKRKITLFLANKPLDITTDFDGSYAAKITIPYEYVPTMTLYAAYIPSGNDADTYLASKSPPVVANILFYHTLLELSAPKTAYPELSITLGGQISSTDGIVDRKIRVFLDNTQLVEQTARSQFHLELTPPQIPTGEHSLTVTVDSQWRYAGASRRLPLIISRLPIEADIEMPHLVIIPKPIQISGKVYHKDSPVPDAKVSLNFKNSSSTARTSTNGSFSTSLAAPLDLSLVGFQEIRIIIEPVQPWHTPLQVNRPILTISPANTGLMLVVLISLGLLAYKRGRTSPIRPQEEIIPAQVSEPPAITPTPLTPKLKPKPTGIKGQILSAYTSGLEAVEKHTISMAPHITLREFLKMVTPLLPTASTPFAELTTIAEVALYSVRKLDESIAARAEQLAATIKEELHRGTT